jgi:hypothetical protein
VACESCIYTILRIERPAAKGGRVYGTAKYVDYIMPLVAAVSDGHGLLSKQSAPVVFAMTRKYPVYMTGYSNTRLYCQRLLFPAILTCVAFAAVGGCTREPITSWDSPRLLEVQKQWDAIASIKTQDKSVYQELLDKQLHILESNLSYDALRNLTATCDTLPVRAKDRSAFINAVLAHMERTFIDSGDRGNLVKLLSTRCQLEVGIARDIEFYLVYYGKKLKDPILVLGEAFTKCKVPEVRHDIAGAVRRAFAGHGIRGKDDAEYVTNAMQWYEKEKDHLIVNGEYSRNSEWVPGGTYDYMPELYDKLEKDLASPKPRMQLLFKEKPSEK